MVNINALLSEWAYRCKKGYPDLDSPSDIKILKNILKEQDITLPQLQEQVIIEQEEEGPSKKELIDLIVWERGAGKTMACGTAACAAVVAAVTNNHVSEKVQVRLPGGILDINYSKGKTVVMSGPTEINFNGEYKIN